MTADPNGYSAWFAGLTGFPPHPWQNDLGQAAPCADRLLRIPTGFGKTAGTVLAWLWNVAVRGDLRWPRRLVFCLPMRVLVEQTEAAIRAWLVAAGFQDRVGLHVLMGGVEAQPWVLDPERPTILVGTQDMLLSRALNRGYGAARGRWPIEFGLLNVDSLWVMDEVQIMGVGLATSVQLAAFRNSEVEAGRMPRMAACWWMSATLQPAWLETVDFSADAQRLGREIVTIPSGQREGGLWQVSKDVESARSVGTPKEIAQLVSERHRAGSLTLVVVNAVKRASEVRVELESRYSTGKGAKRVRAAHAPEIRLVHSRFRGVERAAWAQEFLHRDAAFGEAGRIIVATQVIEAGVDISAALLVTDLAPWPSLVQRFGRVARYVGERGTLVVIGDVPADDKAALPYTPASLAAAAEALDKLAAYGLDGSPRGLEAFEDRLRTKEPKFLGSLYPYAPAQVVRRDDVTELFDTTPDLSGSDLDVSVYIREGEDRDVSVFWRDVEVDRIPGRDLAPRREELCPVPLHELREFVKRSSAAVDRPLVLDYVDGVWLRRPAERIVPGMTVLLPARLGGYDPELGWSPSNAKAQALPLTVVTPDPFTQTAEAEDSDELSVAPWKTIATHGREARELVRTICEGLGMSVSLVRLIELAARWHDAGKAHPVFQHAIRETIRALGGVQERTDLAKAPVEAWVRPRPYRDRPGFRHELVSVLMLFEVLRRARPDHPALLGGVSDILEALEMPGVTVSEVEQIASTHPLAAELAELSADDFDLVAWLVCTHHGKVRMSWSSTILDQDAGHGGIHGVVESDSVPQCALTTGDDRLAELPATQMFLSLASLGLDVRYGRSWSDRASSLVQRLGGFQLAWLEAILRAADVRASMLTTKDPLL